jgi:sugar phosphate permease
MPLLSRDFLFSKNDLAQLIFLYSVAYSCGQFIAGTAADRWGGRRVVTMGMLLSARSTFAMAGVCAFWVFGALQLINGFAQSAGWPGLLKITGAWFDPARRGVLMAWWTTNYVAGGFLATILATWLVSGPLAPGLGWKAGVIGPAALLLFVTLAFLLMVRDRPGFAPTGQPAVSAWKEVLASPALSSIAVSYFCLKLVRYAFLFWLPLYMVEKLNYGVGEAGYASSAYELIGFLGVPLAGYVSDRILGGRRFPVGAVMLFCLSISCWVLPQLSALSHTANLIAIGLVGILTYGPDTLMSGAATQDSVSPGATATAAGFVNGVGSAGQLASPLLVAAAVRWSGWNGLFVVFSGVALLGGIVLSTRWFGDRAVEEVLEA